MKKELLSNQFENYFNYCKRSAWLSYRESYKFRFARWINSHIDFDSQSDEEILTLCEVSQNQHYYDDSTEAGLNFIKSALRFQDSFISLNDIKLIRNLYEGATISDGDLKDSPLSYPKLSVWLGSFFPDQFNIYASDELTTSISYFYNEDLTDISGAAGFQTAMRLLYEIREHITEHYKKEIEILVAKVFPEDPAIRSCDISWLIQDFTLYVNRRILNRKENYYWVNQGNSYKREKEAGIIAAPTSNLHHHKRLKDLIEGDTIIHYSEGAIQAVSTVTTEFKISPRPYESRELSKEDCFIVGVDYKELESPIPLEQVQDLIRSDESVLPKKYSPFNKKLEINQAYCLNFTVEAFNLLFGNTQAEETVLIRRLKDIGKEAAHLFYDLAEGLVLYIEVEEGDERLTYNLPQNHLIGITVGQRYCLTVQKKQAGIEWMYNQDPEDKEHWYKVIRSSEELRANKDLLFRNCAIELSRSNKSSYRTHNSELLERSIFDSTYREKILNKAFPNGRLDNEQLINLNKEKMRKNNVKNMILYGPPGTGKTYITKEMAVQIANPDFPNHQDLTATENRRRILEEYDLLSTEGRIIFTTFHQSFSYEDFVEGIKPVMVNQEQDEAETSEIQYEIRDGILKELVRTIEEEAIIIETTSNNLYIPKEKFELPINKVSLGNSQKAEDKEIFDYCMEHDCIAIGFGEDIDFSDVKSRADIRKKYKDAGIEVAHSMDFKISAIERLVLWMKPGQLVFVSEGTRKLKAIGEVTGEYYCDPESPIEYSQFRKVKWLYKDLELPIEDIYGRRFSQQTIYQISSGQMKYEKYFAKQPIAQKQGKSNFVLIIDEINRGNVSAIFGELITLIETDKRLGQPEAIKVKLPYSQKEFGIPENLYLIGTMNTADRSVEALDTALRRRFAFIEMMPKPALLRDKEVSGINLEVLLQTINDRIEILIDRDHTIGHSYFMNINSTQDLLSVFKDKVLPLLQEYFYGDYGKIGLVLGEGFVSIEKNEQKLFANFEYPDQNSLKVDTYSLKPINESNIIGALHKLMGIETKSVGV